MKIKTIHIYQHTHLDSMSTPSTASNLPEIFHPHCALPTPCSTSPRRSEPHRPNTLELARGLVTSKLRRTAKIHIKTSFHPTSSQVSSILACFKDIIRKDFEKGAASHWFGLLHASCLSANPSTPLRVTPASAQTPGLPTNADIVLAKKYEMMRNVSKSINHNRFHNPRSFLTCQR